MPSTNPMLQAELFKKPDPNEELHEVAEKFEAIFLYQMRKPMREAK